MDVYWATKEGHVDVLLALFQQAEVEVEQRDYSSVGPLFILLQKSRVISTMWYKYCYF